MPKHHFNFRDITGRKYGRLTVTSFSGMGDRRSSLWVCKCSCGNEKILPKMYLTRGTQSCGCLKKESAGKGASKRTKSGTAFRILLCRYKLHARNRGLSWSLTEEQFRLITSSPCHYTGRLPNTVMKADSGEVYIYNGVDRLDNSMGYTLENCVACCQPVNMMKKVLSYADFITLCMEISEHTAKVVEEVLHS